MRRGDPVWWATPTPTEPVYDHRGREVGRRISEEEFTAWARFSPSTRCFHCQWLGRGPVEAFPGSSVLIHIDDEGRRWPHGPGRP